MVELAIGHINVSSTGISTLREVPCRRKPIEESASNQCASERKIKTNLKVEEKHNEKIGSSSLRAAVPKNQTFSKYGGNSQKINSAQILKLGRPWCETNHDILGLAEYRFIYEKIDNNRIPSKCRFWCSKFKKNLEASRHKMKQARPIKTIKSWKPTSKLMLTAVWALLVNLFFEI